MSDLFNINPLWGEFSFFELTKIMRQKNELKFNKTLNNLAVGKMSEEDVSLIKSREVTEEVPHDTIRLFSENIEVEKFNDLTIENMPGKIFFSEAKDNISGKVGEKTKSTILNSSFKKRGFRK